MSEFYPDLGKYFKEQFGTSENQNIIFSSSFILFSIAFNCFENGGSPSIIHNNHLASIDFDMAKNDSIVALALKYNLIDTHNYTKIKNRELVNIQTPNQSFVYNETVMVLKMGVPIVATITNEEFIPLILESIKILK
jgi:hypothetical protein